MAKRLILLILLLGLTGVCFGQTSFFTDRAVGTFPLVGQGGVTALVPIQYGQVRACQFSAAPSSPCNVGTAQVFDLNGNPLTIQGSNFGQISTDVVGRFSFGCVSGVSYTIQVAASSSNVPQLSYPITCNGNIGGSPIFSSLTVTGSITAASINGILFADQCAGADGGQKINTCIGLLPASGGTIFAQGLGAHTWSTNVFPGNKAVDIYLPASTITLTSVQTMPENVNIHCVPSTDTTHGTTFTGTINAGSWFSWTDVFTGTMDGCSFVKTGTAGGTLFSVVGSKEIYLKNFQNISGNWNDILFINSDANGSASYNHFNDWFVQGWINNGIHFNSTGGASKVVTDNQFSNLTFLGAAASTCILFDSAATSPIGENNFDGGDCTLGTNALNINTNQARDNTFRGTFFENATGTGVNIVSGAINTTFLGCQVTANGTNVTDNGSNTVWLGNVAGVARQFSVSPAGDTNFNSLGIQAAGSGNPGGINMLTGNCIALSGTNNLCFQTAGPFMPGTKSFSLGSGGLVLASLAMTTTAPSIAAAGCGGGAATIPNNNGTAAFEVNVGTTPGSACTVTMPAAAHGWACQAVDVTTNSTSVFLQKLSPAASLTTTQIVITNFNDVAVATAYVASDVLRVQCTGY